MNSLLSVFLSAMLLATPVRAEMHVPVQLRVKSPAGFYPTESGVSFRLLVLTPGTNCILREEEFSGQEIVNGNISLSLGAGARGAHDPNLSLNQIYDNSTAKSNLSCVDAGNNVISTGQTYTPAADAQRTLRVVSVINAESITVNFAMKATPYAIQAESVGGKRAADVIVRTAGTEMNQANLNDLLLNTTKLNNLKNIADSSQTTNFTGNLAGDVTGTQGATTVARLRGQPVSTTAPTSGQVLQYDGTGWAPSTLPGFPVTSVAGRTGDVVLSHTDISGLGTAAVLDTGTSAGNVVELDSGGKIPVSTVPNSVLNTSSTAAGDVSGTFSALSVDTVGGKTAAAIAAALDDLAAATNSNTANQLVRRDGSGDVAVANLSAMSTSVRNLYLYNASNNSVQMKVPSSFVNYVLTLPDGAGATGQVLTTDGSGVLSWTSPTVGTVTSVSASAPLSSSGGATPTISVAQATTSADGYLSSTDWNTFNGKQDALGFTPLNAANNLSDVGSAATARTNLGLGGAAVLNVGTAAGTVAAGDDARITGALQSATFDGYVASASCDSTETMYWNSVSGTFACQSITTGGDVSGSADSITVDTVGGKTAAAIAAALDDLDAATNANTASQLVRRDASGNVAVGALSATSGSLQSLYIYNATITNSVQLKTPATFSTYSITLPGDDGTSGQVLTTDGSGVLSWTSPTVGTVTSVSASAPLNSSGGATPTITIAQATTSADGYLSSTDWNTFNGKQDALGFTPLNAASNLSDLGSAATARTNLGLGGAAVLNVGTATGTVAAGDDARITGALQSATFDSYVASAACTDSQRMYWDSVNDVFSCQSIATGGDVSGTVDNVTVATVGGKTAAAIAAALDDLDAATDANTASQLVRRDASGNIVVGVLSATTGSVRNLNVRNASNNTVQVSVPASFTNYALTLPGDDGTSGQVLTTDGSGVLSWTSPTVGTVTAVSASAPLSSSGGATPNLTIAQATTSADGYLSSTDWNTFNGKQDALGFTPLNAASNLSDLGSAATARTNLGLGGAAVLNVGTAAGTVAAGDDSRITGALQSSVFDGYVASASCAATETMYWNSSTDKFACQSLAASGDVSGTADNIVVDKVGGKTAAAIAAAVDDLDAATDANTASQLVRRDASGDVAVSALSSTSHSTQDIYIFESTNTNRVQLRAPASFSNYALTLPVDDGTSGQVLTTDGSGVLSWTSPTVGTVTAVSASAPLSSSGGATPNLTISKADTSTNGYLSSADWNIFNGKQDALGFTPLNAASDLGDLGSAATARSNLGLGGAAVLAVGTTAGTVAAGDDARITGALSVSAFNADVASASCSTTETMYWSSVTNQFECQTIAFPAAPVTTVAGRSGDVTLVSGDITGLGSAAGLDAGSSAGDLVQLDGDGRIPASVLPAAGLPSYIKLTANRTFSVTGPDDVDGLSFSAESGVTYKYRFHVLFTSVDVGTGLNLGLTYPSATVASATASIPTAAAGTAAVTHGYITSSGDSVLSSGTPASGTVYLAVVEGIIVPSSNGDVQLQAASGVGSSDVVIQAGSFVEVTALP